MRNKYLIANWKANPESVFKARNLAANINNCIKRRKTSAFIIVALPFVYIESIRNIIKKSKLHLAVQDFFNQERGSYTAQVTTSMLSSLNVKYSILGHSEVREENGDDNHEINQKIKLALKYNIIPIICLGEKQKNQTEKVLLKQFNECLGDIKAKDIKKIILCYEPIWAISKGKSSHKSANASDAQKAHVFLRKQLTKKYGVKIADQISIIYGGSIKPKNSKELFEQLDIDGGLVGSSSLSANKFCGIIKNL